MIIRIEIEMASRVILSCNISHVIDQSNLNWSMTLVELLGNTTRVFIPYEASLIAVVFGIILLSVYCLLNIGKKIICNILII